jgi:hypothetical protein
MGIGRLKVFVLSLAATFAVATNAQSQNYLNGYLQNYGDGSVGILSGVLQYGTFEVIDNSQVPNNSQPSAGAATLDFSNGGYVASVAV